jgi:hypothetical protein
MFGFCLPATIYLVIGFIGVLSSLAIEHFPSAIFQAIGVFVWAYILNFICSKGYKGVSWFLIIFGAVLNFSVAMMMVKKSMNQQMQKPPPGQGQPPGQPNY